MRHAGLRMLAFALCLAAPLTALAQADILPEPNVLPTMGDDSGWPLRVEPEPTSPTSAQTSSKSLLSLCARWIEKGPAPLTEPCLQFVREAIEASRARLAALQDRQAHLAKRAQFRDQHARATLEVQRHQGTIVFWLVLIVIGVGLLAAGAQFLRSLLLRDDSGSAEVAVSNNELRFKTTWLGALLLGMSMGFLALYLFFIYPVRYVGGG